MILTLTGGVTGATSPRPHKKILKILILTFSPDYCILLLMETVIDKNASHYFITCVADFAEKYKMSIKDAFLYLKKFNGIRFLIENYDIEHTLSKEDTMEALSIIARKNGGHLI